MHMVLFTWWCWHICKGEGVGVVVDQLVEKEMTGGRSGLVRRTVRQYNSFCPERLLLCLGLKAVLRTVRPWGADSPQVF